MARKRNHPAVLPPQSEADFQRQVIALAKLHGWLVAHFRPGLTAGGRWVTPMQGDPGYPDLTLVHARRGRVVFAELKSDAGRRSAGQLLWACSLGGAGAEYYLWRPSDWPEVVSVLTR